MHSVQTLKGQLTCDNLKEDHAKAVDIANAEILDFRVQRPERLGSNPLRLKDKLLAQARVEKVTKTVIGDLDSKIVRDLPKEKKIMFNFTSSQKTKTYEDIARSHIIVGHVLIVQVDQSTCDFSSKFDCYVCNIFRPPHTKTKKSFRFAQKQTLPLIHVERGIVQKLRK